MIAAACRRDFDVRRDAEIPAAAAREPFSWKAVLAGLRYIWREKMVLGSISLDMFAVLLGGAVALLRCLRATS